MAASDVHAPVLSTHQDDTTFSYAKVVKSVVSRRLDVPGGQQYLDVVRAYYSINELVSFLKQTDNGSRKFKRVTLQFPDSLIGDSAAIVAELQSELQLNKIEHVKECNKNQVPRSASAACDSETCCDKKENVIKSQKCCGTGSSTSCKPLQPCSLESQVCQKNKGCLENQRLWILADTSYSSCCVDEVAAEHVGADLVIHFGDACLNPVETLPSAYVFGSPKLDTEKVIDSFKERYPIEEFANKSIVLMADAPHTPLLLTLVELLPDYKLVVADLVATGDMHFIGYRPHNVSKSSESLLLYALNRVFNGIDGDDSALSEYDLFHITTPASPRLLQLTTKFLSVTTYENDEISQGPFPNLMRRYRYMHMARAAGTIGILVNTLSLANTKTLIRKISERVKAAGKRHYVFVVGKPNVAKLANFDAVDLWCVLGCDHQGIILDEYNEYFKPIVTPYELLLAIGDEFLWTGKWVTEFERVLKDLELEEPEPESESQKVSPESGSTVEQGDGGMESDEEPEFDPVTGRYVSSARPLRRLQHLQISHNADKTEASSLAQSPQEGKDGVLVKKLGGTVALRGTVSTAAAHLQTREWTGLGSDWAGQEGNEAAVLEEGTSGIARGYDFDTLDASKLHSK